MMGMLFYLAIYLLNLLTDTVYQFPRIKESFFIGIKAGTETIELQSNRFQVLGLLKKIMPKKEL